MLIVSEMESKTILYVPAVTGISDPPRSISEVNGYKKSHKHN
jgi:hypothetical protein